ncbi:hypothetical protein E2562_016561 [Oryza meyeriana var. granulata]|uniref:F-box domain-containing protein n=1 Tax=Oryza meyeriana var. granulata TaxID=110450 RepID=A0A6G1C5U4_9ORYZ|nr:hypothetical protein E2562_016561 [Oryza meyeriana var. granulata]
MATVESSHRFVDEAAVLCFDMAEDRSTFSAASAMRTAWRKTSATRKCKTSNTPISRSGTQGWADLPDDLLQSVLALLSSPCDLVAFTATCPRWRAFFMSEKSTLRMFFRPLGI